MRIEDAAFRKRFHGEILKTELRIIDYASNLLTGTSPMELIEERENSRLKGEKPFNPELLSEFTFAIAALMQQTFRERINGIPANAKIDARKSLEDIVKKLDEIDNPLLDANGVNKLKAGVSTFLEALDAENANRLTGLIRKIEKEIPEIDAGMSGR
jgi:hypothetical protein